MNETRLRRWASAFGMTADEFVGWWALIGVVLLVLVGSAVCS